MNDDTREKFFDLKTVFFIIGSLLTIGVSYGVNREKIDAIRTVNTVLVHKMEEREKADLQSEIQRTALRVELSAVRAELNSIQNRLDEFNRRSLENKSDLEWLKRKASP